MISDTDLFLPAALNLRWNNTKSKSERITFHLGLDLRRSLRLRNLGSCSDLELNQNIKRGDLIVSLAAKNEKLRRQILET